MNIIRRLASQPGQLSRRNFLRVTALGSAGFMIGFPAIGDDHIETPTAQDQVSMNAFIKIVADNTVTVVVKHMDKGQGITTGFAAIVAEELDADWSQMHTEFAPADAAIYNNTSFGPTQGTGGSNAIAGSWVQLREAAAGARYMLVQAAASAWGVGASEIEIVKGVLKHGSHSASFGDLAVLASQAKPPAEPTPKPASEYRLIGSYVPRLDSNAKTDGSQIYTIDLEMEDMQVAVIAHPPRFGAKVASFDAKNAKKIEGVLDVVQIPRGVAVLANSYYAARKGRDSLEIEWDNSAAEMRGTQEIRQHLESHLSQEGVVARNDGDVNASLAKAETVVETQFNFPYLAHATMEPMDCVVKLDSDQCTIWTASQMPTFDQNNVSELTGLRPDQVVIHTQFAGGSFGRRVIPDSDYIVEAVMVVQAIKGKAPVKLIWTREDDFAAGRYRPMAAHKLRGAIDEDGNITAWDHRFAVQSVLAGGPFGFFIQNSLDPMSLEGAAQLPYTIDNVRVDYHSPEVGVPVSWWRSVGHSHNGYATEVFFDQLARKAGKDPFELRRKLLQDHPRHLAVLEKAAEEAGWGSPLPKGRARGIAVHEAYNTFVAEVAEIELTEAGELTIHRIICAVDCGIAITPDIIKAQMEGGIGFGLSAALREGITMTEGVVDQQNFDTYQSLRMSEMPEIDVHIIASEESPTGVGEPGVPPSSAAVANAIASLTGQVIVDLPIGDQLKQS